MRGRELVSGAAALLGVGALGRLLAGVARRGEERRAEVAAWLVLVVWGFAGAAACGFVVAVVVRASNQTLGGLLALSLGLVSLGFVLAAHFVVPTERGIEDRDVDEDVLPGALVELKHGGERYGRRAFVALLLGVPAALLAAAAGLRAAGIGTGGERALRRTAWQAGVPLVRDDGEPLSADDVVAGTPVLVYPEGAVGRGDSQAIVIRVPAERVRPLEGRADWSPDGLVAYSTICTHAGCTVALYQTDEERLFCPCHQSAFDVLRAAAPVAGPATRRLPQLPLEIGEDGVVVAGGDFSAPVGPLFWDRDP